MLKMEKEKKEAGRKERKKKERKERKEQTKAVVLYSVPGNADELVWQVGMEVLRVHLPEQLVSVCLSSVMYSTTVAVMLAGQGH